MSPCPAAALLLSAPRAAVAPLLANQATVRTSLANEGAALIEGIAAAPSGSRLVSNSIQSGPPKKPATAAISLDAEVDDELLEDDEDELDDDPLAPAPPELAPPELDPPPC